MARGVHKTDGINWHPKDPALKPWLEAEAGERGTTKSEILDEALGEYREKAEFLRPLRDARETGDANAEMRDGLRGALTTETETTGETR